MNNDTWERDGKGNLIPFDSEIEVTDKFLKQEIAILERKTNALEKDATKKQEFEVHKKAISLLKDALAEKTEKIKIKYTPLLYYEVQYILRNLGLDGEKQKDVDAEICSKHCLEPCKSYTEWVDQKDPLLKFAISSFIIENSYPKREKSNKEVEAFRLLQ